MATRERDKKRRSHSRKMPAAPKVRSLAEHGKVKHRPSVDRIISKARKVVSDRKKGKDTEAVTPAVLVDLGPVLLPTPENAVKVLAELADLNDRALQAHKAYLERQTAAKNAKESWEGLAKAVQEKLRMATHASGLPLFSEEERERDQAAMEASADPPNEKTGTDDEPTL